jgi:micrococcal nuclease
MLPRLSMRMAWMFRMGGLGRSAFARVMLGFMAWLPWHAPILAACQLTKGPEKSVARVIDAETLALDDGTEVRLSGALTPRAGDTGAAIGQWPAETAAQAFLDTLTIGKTIRLHFDTTRQDRHGRWLAQVFINSAGGPQWLQAAMLTAGHARADSVVGQRACIDDLAAHEAVARAAGTGVWREAAYRVRDAAAPQDIAGYRGTFQVLTGQVQSIERARDLTRLLLGTDRLRAVSLSIRSNDRELIGALGGDLAKLKGRSVEARGWIGQRSGRFAAPDIDLTLAGFVRVLADDAVVKR